MRPPSSRLRAFELTCLQLFEESREQELTEGRRLSVRVK
jgi:hypothetical protein